MTTTPRGLAAKVKAAEIQEQEAFVALIALPDDTSRSARLHQAHAVHAWEDARTNANAARDAVARLQALTQS